MNKEVKERNKALKSLVRYIKKVINRIMSLADDTDVEGTISGIKGGIVLEGSNLWILICSTFIACIGLDTNSPAVIIGAMLISPLMSPILGIGLSVGINDRDSLMKSLRNFAVAISLSLMVSIVYFTFTPFGNFTDEMKARITPTALDALVALFGGLAGIIAGSRTNKTNAIPGVAIATALMPPLCTSGFGLATGRGDVFFGAFYLFFINAVLISISTYVIVRILKFPQVEILDPVVAKRATMYGYIFLTLLMIPSFIFLMSSLKNITESNVLKSFIQDNIHDDVEKGAQWTYRADNDSTGTLKVYYFGSYIAPDSVGRLQFKLVKQMKESLLLRFSVPDSLGIELTPTDAPPDEERKQLSEEMTELRLKVLAMEQVQNNDMEKKTTAVDSLKNELTKVMSDSLPFNEISDELKAIFPEVEKFAIARTNQTSFDSLGKKQVVTALVKWDKSVYRAYDKKQKQDRIEKFLEVKLKRKEVEVVSY
ncbi:DUF389 domain-containing protein [Chondrinema litorale]|uniref:DUF389 domain-containing protein n=1 Tax=Chondrinema litorale TaxID=2994555 RepID=UPI0025429174|nr:DUF389 domain-containing protein [Chondrinema litorale]UZR98636.1 DUF389 domain-containing protein [Chondrinema litorale]